MRNKILTITSAQMDSPNKLEKYHIEERLIIITVVQRLPGGVVSVI
jgi:hypothetical protein